MVPVSTRVKPRITAVPLRCKLDSPCSSLSLHSMSSMSFPCIVPACARGRDSHGHDVCIFGSASRASADHACILGVPGLICVSNGCLYLNSIQIFSRAPRLSALPSLAMALQSINSNVSRLTQRITENFKVSFYHSSRLVLAHAYIPITGVHARHTTLPRHLQLLRRVL